MHRVRRDDWEREGQDNMITALGQRTVRKRAQTATII